MLNANNVVSGTLTRSRTAFALIAATLLVGGSISEASAKSRHHRHHSHHASKAQAPGTSWLDSNASIGSQSTGRGFWGKASYYGSESGSRTASGQRFNQNAMTAAHRSLPFGTKLRVTHRGQSVIVTVNDRGPFIRGRILDLSKGAARAIGLTGAGVGHVTAEVVS
jgi:rare lipoprotein A